MDKDKEKIKSSEGSGFQFGILDSEHLVWNPLVHKLYEENCHFFLIRVRRVDAFFYQTLDQYFQQAHIAASISLLSGYFDALVRVWTTPEKLKLLSTVISTSEVFLEEIREFRVQDIEYLWSTRLLQDKDLSKYRNSIETIRKQSVQGLELDQQLLQNLISLGLIYKRQPVNSGFLFYIALSPISPSGSESRNEHQDYVRNFIAEIGGQVSLLNASIYHGIGFTNHMIEAVTQDYSKFVSCIARISQYEPLQDLRATTFLITDRKPEHIHHISSYPDTSQAGGLFKSEIKTDKNGGLEAINTSVLLGEQLMQQESQMLNQSVISPANTKSSEPLRPMRIFLCHSSSDKSLVRDLYRRLREDGFEPWLDEENLLPGQDWQQEISKAVRNSDIVLACLTTESVNKKGYVQKEIRFALDVADQQPEDTIYLIPVKLKECGIPERLRKWQWVELFQENGYQRLIKALRRRLITLDGHE